MVCCIDFFLLHHLFFLSKLELGLKWHVQCVIILSRIHDIRRSSQTLMVDVSLDLLFNSCTCEFFYFINANQNVDILVPANPGPPGKWPLKWREREREG